MGNRTEKSVDADGAGAGSAVVTRFAYDAWNPAKTGPVGTENSDVWADFNGSSLTTRYFRGDAIDQLIARIDGTTPCWYLADEQGSINQVIDSAGVVKDAITYNAWGNILSETNSAERGRYAWTGREIDVETGLQYNLTRWHDRPVDQSGGFKQNLPGGSEFITMFFGNRDLAGGKAETDYLLSMK